MPLQIEILRAELYKINVQEDPDFIGFGNTVQQVATNWSNVIYNYTLGIIPISANQEFAKQSFRNILLSLSLTQANGSMVFTQAFAAHAALLASGMAPTFVAVPPFGPINFNPVFELGFSGGSSTQCSDMMALAIDSWYRTGSAVPSVGGGAINWS